MPAAVKLRTDYSVGELRRLAKGLKGANQSRRLLSLAAVLDGMNRADAAAAWIARCCATGFIGSTKAGPDGLRDTWASGPTSRLSAAQKAQLADIIEAGPDREIDGVVRWRRSAAEGARLLAYERAPASSWPEHRDD